MPGFIVPEHAIDAQSLIALADLVISAGGTMNREAVALGTPVYTTFEGRLGAVDERLIAEGRLRALTSTPSELDLRGAPSARPRRRVCAARPAACCWSCCSSPLGRRVPQPRAPAAGRLLAAYNLLQCADGSARRPSRSTVTRCRSWQWTGRWSRSRTTSPSSCASTTGRRLLRDLREAHDLVGARREPAGAGALPRLPAPLALRGPARLRGGRARGRRDRRCSRSSRSRSCARCTIATPHRRHAVARSVLPNGVIVLFACSRSCSWSACAALARSVYERRPLAAFRGGRKGERTVLIAGAGRGRADGRCARSCATASSG